ncbi:threonine dehydratase, partial [Phenoliferia sp. Uapishka_3]
MPDYPNPTVVGLVPSHAAATSRPPSPKLAPVSLADLSLKDDGNSILLPHGLRVPRPKVAPNPALYTRLPPHLVQADGSPNYLPLLLTSSVYSILPAGGTPLTPATSLSARLGSQIYFKREDLTPVFSFKVRGAYNLMKQLTEEERWRGVVACSAGNHAQGVALAGRELGIACTIVMPLNTPSIKYNNVDRMGAKVVLHGADFDEAKRECARLAKVHGLTDIPPFDDPYVIAGQGTCGVEILRQTDVSKLDAIFVCVGGGGLLAGILEYVKAVAPPHVKVIGVETHDADAMNQSLRAGERLTLKEVGLFADGTAVRQLGEETYRICANLVDEIVLVSNDEICAAIKDVFEDSLPLFADTRSVPEPSGALAVAGMKKYIQENNLIGKGKRFVATVSGANLNFSRLRFIAERADVGEGKEAMLRVIIPEKPGAFLALHSIIHPRAVTEFVYRYSSTARAFIFLSFYLSSPSNLKPAAPSLLNGQSTPIPSPQQVRHEELSSILSQFTSQGMKALDISENELAKSHARYLVGGRSNVPDERIFRFEFPERPRALRTFLEGLATRFNISLFHYRNQGGDIGKVLAGIQVPKEEEAAFDEWLAQLGYPYTEETNNVVFKDFLQDEE